MAWKDHLIGRPSGTQLPHLSDGFPPHARASPQPHRCACSSAGGPSRAGSEAWSPVSGGDAQGQRFPVSSSKGWWFPLVSVSSKQEVVVRGSSNFLWLYPKQRQGRAPQASSKGHMGAGVWGGCGAEERQATSPARTGAGGPRRGHLSISEEVQGWLLEGAHTSRYSPAVQGRRSTRKGAEEVGLHPGLATAVR